MMKAIRGVYRNGKVELREKPEGFEGAAVIVTFLSEAKDVDLEARGIDETQAADLRARLSSFVEDWNRPEMQAYDAL